MIWTTKSVENKYIYKRKYAEKNILTLNYEGMADTTCERQVVLDKYLDGVNDMLIFSGTQGYINPKFKKVGETVYANEKGIYFLNIVIVILFKCLRYW